MKRSYSILFLIILIAFSSACATKKTPAPPVVREAGIADLRNFPQDLMVYANLVDPDKRLLEREAQQSLNRAFLEIYFGPWSMGRTTAKKRDVVPFFKKARGYKDAASRWSQPEWDAMAVNANLANFPARATPGITLRQTDLRELPTHVPRFSEPTANIRENPFDYFQYSLLPPGMPLLIAHTSQDGRWHYIECPIATGWVDARDVALASDDFRRQYRTGQYAALIRDKIDLPGSGMGHSDSKAGLGAIFPLLSNSNNALNVVIPIANAQGYAETAEISLSNQAAAIMPMALTPANVAKVGNAAMGQPYGWGGTLAERDCSALMRDLFTPFGIWLPRNSRAQARRGEVISLAGMTQADKTSAILKYGEPFISLLGMRGHIGLYVGDWKGKPAIFHNVWGVRVVKEGNDNEREVIGRTVVTSISPGMELENLYRPVTFIDRLTSLTILGKRR